MLRLKNFNVIVMVGRPGPKAYEAKACVRGPLPERGARVMKKCGLWRRSGSARRAIKDALHSLTEGL